MNIQDHNSRYYSTANKRFSRIHLGGAVLQCSPTAMVLTCAREAARGTHYHKTDRNANLKEDSIMSDYASLSKPHIPIFYKGSYNPPARVRQHAPSNFEAQERELG